MTLISAFAILAEFPVTVRRSTRWPAAGFPYRMIGSMLLYL